MKIPTEGWTNYNGELKRIWPSRNTVLIYDEATLSAFRDRVNNGETSLNGTVVASFSLSEEWTPIANYASDSSLRYTGTFDGGGYTITGLMINGSGNYQGLFGVISSSSTVKGLSITNGAVNGGFYVGGIVGWNSGGTVQNCIYSGIVNGSNYYTGGIIGYNTSTGAVQNCTNSATVSGIAYVGGIVGWNDNNCTVSGNSNEGSVIATDDPGFAGGIVGYNGGGTVSGNINTGNITSASGSAGGIVGHNVSNGIISSNTNTGSVTGGTTNTLA